MMLALDIGNSQIFGGVFDAEDALVLHFRHETNSKITSDQWGIFLRNVLKENQIDANNICQIGISSVVPSMDYSLRSACIKYFKINPFFLNANNQNQLKIKTNQPDQVGADLIATAIAAVFKYPQKNIIIIDLGTVSTVSIISKNNEFLGASFFPGIKLSMQALGSQTAKLFPVEIIQPIDIIGRSTTEAIQSGIYYSQLGAMREVIARVKKTHFLSESLITIGTGGFANLFKAEKIFDSLLPDLILEGIKIASHSSDANYQYC